MARLTPEEIAEIRADYECINSRSRWVADVRRLLAHISALEEDVRHYKLKSSMAPEVYEKKMHDARQLLRDVGREGGHLEHR